MCGRSYRQHRGSQRVQRAKVDGALKMQDFEYGQAALTFAGRLEVEEVEEVEIEEGDHTTTKKHQKWVQYLEQKAR